MLHPPPHTASHHTLLPAARSPGRPLAEARPCSWPELPLSSGPARLTARTRPLICGWPWATQLCIRCPLRLESPPCHLPTCHDVVIPAFEPGSDASSRKPAQIPPHHGTPDSPHCLGLPGSCHSHLLRVPFPPPLALPPPSLAPRGPCTPAPFAVLCGCCLLSVPSSLSSRPLLTLVPSSAAFLSRDLEVNSLSPLQAQLHCQL